MEEYSTFFSNQNFENFEFPIEVDFDSSSSPLSANENLFSTSSNPFFEGTNSPNTPPNLMDESSGNSSPITPLSPEKENFFPSTPIIKVEDNNKMDKKDKSVSSDQSEKSKKKNQP